MRPFPGPGALSPVSTSSGIYPRWGRDGKELYYVAPDGTLMAAPITVRGATLEAGTPVPLFLPHMVGGGVNAVARRHQYDVAPDGRFIINVTTDDAIASPITVILNWHPE